MNTVTRDERGHHRILVADVGGTFLRLALAQGGELVSPPATLAREPFSDLIEACRTWRDQAGSSIDLQGAVIAAAGSRQGRRLEMTNAAWTIEAGQLAAGLGIASERLVLLNDFEALAWSLPALRRDELIDLPGGARPAAGLGSPSGDALGNQVVLGPGTGLGVAAVIRIGRQWHPMPSEGGHMGFSPCTPFERTLAALAAERFGRVSWERVLSGSGLGLIHRAARREAGEDAVDLTASEDPVAVLEGCRRGEANAVRAVQCFIELLGAFAGDLALSFDARGGVILTGGMFERVSTLVPLEAMRTRFEDKGRFRSWLESVPLRRLGIPHAALRGAARAYLADD